MVENLTLEKMSCGINGYTNEQFSQLFARLEGVGGSSEQLITLDVSYRLGGQELRPRGRLTLSHSGQFRCGVCDRLCKKLFDGFCYPCLQTSAQADRCVLNPVGCHYMQGTCREPRWGEEFCYQPHYVYLSYTDKFKVGITRVGQVPTRWIDQGATMAVLVARVGSRHQAGLLEALLSLHYSDKSHWLKMLKSGNSRPTTLEFESVRTHAIDLIKANLSCETGGKYRAPVSDMLMKANEVSLLEEAVWAEIEYPLWSTIPEKISSLNLEKTPTISSEIFGVKGQYLFLEQGVFNVRRHEGYVVACDFQC